MIFSRTTTSDSSFFQPSTLMQAALSEQELATIVGGQIGRTDPNSPSYSGKKKKKKKPAPKGVDEVEVEEEIEA
jgi:hypothetical protein